jgi:hypothetical protein
VNKRQMMTHLLSSTNSSNDDMFMTSLMTRMKEVQEQENKLPLVVLDTMLPRQVMKIQVNNPLLSALIKTQVKKEKPYFGMLGMAKLATGQMVHLTTGVEVELMEKPVFLNEGVQLELKAGRRFKISGEVEDSKQGWTEARVEYFNSAVDEERETQGKDRLAVSRAIMKAKELSSPNGNMKGNLSLIDRWIELARENERQPGQIDQLLNDLGECPPPEEPTDRAFWVGALINPLPALGVAMEIRPKLLTAVSAEERIDIARDGIYRSIRHMDGTSKMW